MYSALSFYISYYCYLDSYHFIHIDDELIANDDDKQKLLNHVIQVCRPKDWQISLLEDRLTESQLAIPKYIDQKRLANILKGRSAS